MEKGKRVLNLIITGIPSIRKNMVWIIHWKDIVLNLIITGIPSILRALSTTILSPGRFKPYYNWNTFNT